MDSIDNDTKIDSDFEYETDSDDCFDLSETNTGTDRFIISDMKFINFKDYPHIYDPFYPHIELIHNQDIMDIIYKFLCINKKNLYYSNLVSLRSTSKLQKKLIDNYMKYQSKKNSYSLFIKNKKIYTKRQRIQFWEMIKNY